MIAGAEVVDEGRETARERARGAVGEDDARNPRLAAIELVADEGQVAGKLLGSAGREDDVAVERPEAPQRERDPDRGAPDRDEQPGNVDLQVRAAGVDWR